MAVLEDLELAAEGIGRALGDVARMQAIQSGASPVLTSGQEQGQANERETHFMHYITGRFAASNAAATDCAVSSNAMSRPRAAHS